MKLRFAPLDATLLAAYFLLAPLHLLAFPALSLRPTLIYGLVAPSVGILLLLRYPRARFAAYVFLSMDSLRWIAAGNLYALAGDIAILVYLQLPRMRRVFPGIDAQAITARWRR